MLKGIKRMFNLTGIGAADNAPTLEDAASAASSTPEADCVERRILLDTAKALDEARQRVAAREAEVERLELVIAEGAKVETTLQRDIASDGGAALAAFVTGSAKPDERLSSMVAIELSARAAKARLPVAQAELEDARRVALKVEVDRNVSARNVMLVEAGKIAAAHRAAWAELCRLNDELLGISAALPPLDRMESTIHNSTVAFEVPSFNLGSSGSWSPIMRHIPDEWRIGPVTARWQAANAALLDDPDADFRKVLDEPVATVPAGSLPPGMTRSVRPATHVDVGTPVNSFGLPFQMARVV